MESLDAIVSRDLRMNMSTRNARSRMESIFIAYHGIISIHDVSWVNKENQKLAISHVLDAIRPIALKDRLGSDLSFSHYDKRKEFQAFIKHAIYVSECFQVRDNGPRNPRAPSNSGASAGSTNRSGNPTSGESTRRASELPLCLWLPHRARGLRHLLKHCGEFLPKEKLQLLAARTEQSKLDTPAQNTRSKSQSQERADKNSRPPTTGRIVSITNSPTCYFTLTGESSSHDCRGRLYDGSDESIMSPRTATEASKNASAYSATLNP